MTKSKKGKKNFALRKSFRMFGSRTVFSAATRIENLRDGNFFSNSSLVDIEEIFHEETGVLTNFLKLPNAYSSAEARHIIVPSLGCE